MEFGEAVKLPFSDLKKLTIAALMFMIPVLNIITMFFGSGYFLESAKSAMKGKFVLPEWEGWGTLFVNGLLALVIGIIWSIPLLIVGFVTVGSALAGIFASATSGVVSGLPVAGFGIGMIIFLILALLTAFVTPVAVLNFVKKDSFGTAFEFGEIFGKAFTGGYFAAWIVAFIYMIVVSWIAGVVSVLLGFTIVLPIIIMGFMNAITGITGLVLIAEAFGSA